MSGAEDRALRSAALDEIAAPDLPYRPPMPRSYQPRIGMLGTGGVSDAHLDAYRAAGWEVVALWNRTAATAAAKRDAYFPNARVEGTWQGILDDPEIDVVDITLHPEHRAPLIKAALKAGKHVLSQKPFVADLDCGEALIQLAEDRGLQLAVNQNGRWAPHMAWMREAVSAGHVGEVISCHTSVHWNHGWTAGTPFDDMPDLILWDFGVHWFDFLTSIIGDRAETVTAAAVHATGQSNQTPLLGQALVRMSGGQASLVFDGAVPFGARDTTYIAGTEGCLRSDGPDLSMQTVTLTTQDGIARPALQGQWFNDGFAGAMGALLCAIEDGKPPANSGRGNLASLALAFAALRSARTGREVAVGSVRSREV
jgi:predicted dehydrogenase